MADKKSTPSSGQDFVVIESGKTTFKDLYTKEDWMAVWMGFIILIVGLFIYLANPPDKMEENFTKYNTTMKEEASKAPFKTIAWHQASDAKKKIRARDQSFGKTIQEFLNAPSRWASNPVDALYRSKAEADAMNAPFKEAADKAKAAQEPALAKAKEAEKAAGVAAFKNSDLNKKAEAEIAGVVEGSGRCFQGQRQSRQQTLQSITLPHRSGHHPGNLFRYRKSHHGPILRPVLHRLLFRLRSRCTRLHG